MQFNERRRNHGVCAGCCGRQPSSRTSQTGSRSRPEFLDMSLWIGRTLSALVRAGAPLGIEHPDANREEYEERDGEPASH